MDCCMFRIDGYQFGSGRAAGALSNGAGSNQRFLVGERQSLAGLQTRQRHFQTGETHHAVDRYVSLRGDRSHSL